MQRDINKLIENAIFLHLSQKRYEIFTRQMSGGREIDFIARRNDKVIYIQATYIMSDKTLRQREFGKLEAIRDNYPKYVVSLDEWTSGSCVNGTNHLHLAGFLRL